MSSDMWLKNLRDRTITGVLLFGLFVALLLLRGWPFAVAVSLCSLLSLLEMFRAMHAASYKPGMWPGITFTVLMYPILQWKGLYGLVALFTVLCAVLIAYSVLIPKRRFLDTLVSVFTMIYPCWFYIFLLLLSDINLLSRLVNQSANQISSLTPKQTDAFSTVVLALAIVGPIASDMGGFFAGHFFGKRPLAPQISPKKTIGGAIGAIVFTVLVLGTGGWLVIHYGYCTELPWRHYFLLGIMISVLAQAGDLMASSIKRFAGIKDFSSLLPGHGGIMDRMDSILFGGVAVFCYLELFFF